MGGGDPGRTSRVERWAPARWDRAARMSRLLEKADYGPEEHTTPLVRGPLAYLGHSGKAFSAVRWKDGAVAWTFPMRGRVLGTAAAGEGLFAVADDQGDLVAVSLEGREIWRFHVPYPILEGPLIAGGKVYVGVADQNVFCLEAANGRPLWQYGRKFPRRNALWRTPGLAFGEGRLYAGFADGSVVALDAELGKVLWRAEVAKEGLFADVCAGPSYRDGRVYAGALKGPTVCLDAATGKEVWRVIQEAGAGFAVGDDLLYLGNGAGGAVALRRADGTGVWERPLDGGSASAPVLAGDLVLVGASEGGLFAFDARTGAEVARYSPGSGVGGQPLPFEEGLLLFTNVGVLHWLEREH